MESEIVRVVSLSTTEISEITRLKIPWRRRCRRRRAKTLIFCYISIITEDIYLKLGVRVQSPNSNPYYQGKLFKMHFYFGILPFFNLEFLFSIKHLTAERWHPYAVLLF